MQDDIAGLLDFTDKVAVVTGASRGIGRAIAQTFAAAGARVALLARSGDQLRTVADEMGADACLVVPTDVAEADQVEAAVAQVDQAWGRIDILVNNAGLIQFAPLDQVEPADWDRVLAANLSGPYLMCRAMAPVMARGGGGRIVNITSVSADTGGVSGAVSYTASKGGLAAMTKTLARDLAPQGITVNSISPGQIDADPDLITDAQRAKVTAMIPLGRLGEPVEIAYAALFLASPMAAYITGARLDVNGGIYKG